MRQSQGLPQDWTLDPANRLPMPKTADAHHYCVRFCRVGELIATGWRRLTLEVVSPQHARRRVQLYRRPSNVGRFICMRSKRY